MRDDGDTQSTVSTAEAPRKMSTCSAPLGGARRRLPPSAGMLIRAARLCFVWVGELGAFVRVSDTERDGVWLVEVRQTVHATRDKGNDQHRIFWEQDDGSHDPLRLLRLLPRLSPHIGAAEPCPPCSFYVNDDGEEVERG